MPNKPASNRRKTVSQKQKEEEKAQELARQQLLAIIVFALGILLFFITFIRGQNIWLWIHKMILGLFGSPAYLIAPIFIYIAVMATLDRPIGQVGSKVWQSLILICLLSGTIQVFGDGIPKGDLVEKFSFLYQNGIQLHGGGAISGIFGLPLLHWFGATGAKISMILLLFVFLMIFTGSTLVDLYYSAKKPVKKIEEAYVAHAGEWSGFRQKAQNRPLFNIDIPVDEKPDITDEVKMLDEPTSPSPDRYQRAKQRKKAKLEKMQQADPAENEDDSPYLDDLINRVANPSRPTNADSREAMNPQNNGFPDSASPSQVDADILDLLKAQEINQPHPPEVHEIYEVPPEQIMEEGFDHDGVSFSMGTTSPEITEVEEEPEYTFPPITILNEVEQHEEENLQDELKSNAEKLVNTLQSFGVQTRIIDIARGPAVTRYELQPSAGVKISKITNLADDIALNLAASGVRIEAPIPNKPAVGIEVPNKLVSMVSIREVIDSDGFGNAQSKLSVALGRDIAGKITVADLSKMPHVLIAGSTGSGKSVCINSLIISILYKSLPQEVKMILIDPKMVELGIYNGIPHLLIPVVTDAKKAAGALAWAVNEMLDRYQRFKENNVRDLSGYNRMAVSKGEKPMPQVVIIIDELADLMMAAPGEVEDSICRLAQMARAAGMHLVIATQRPSVDVITGVIKANIPSRIAFAVSSQIDSRTILDAAGAEKLLGRGDMLFAPVGATKPTRIQGCFVTDGEVERIVEFIKQAGHKLTYDQQIIDEIDRHTIAEKKKNTKEKDVDTGGGFENEDEMLPSAIECVVEVGQASTSQLQRKLKLGYARAARLMDVMETKGIIGPSEGSKPRQVLINRERWMEMKLCAAQRAEDNRRNY